MNAGVSTVPRLKASLPRRAAPECALISNFIGARHPVDHCRPAA
jgi:hypothetical protein